MAPGQPRYKRVFSKRLQLSIPLPDRAGWKLRRDKGSFVVLEHAATASRLEISIWPERENMNRQRCEQRARLMRDLPSRDKPVDNVLVAVPDGFDTRVDVGFSASGPGEPIAGYAIAFGGNVRRCFAFAYTTLASGDDAEQRVGARLAAIQGLTLEGLELRSDLSIDR